MELVEASSSEPIAALLCRLWRLIGSRRRKQFAILLILMLLAAFSEILSIGAVVPFLAILTAPDRVFQFSALQPSIEFLGLTEPKQLLFPLTLAFGLAALVAGSMRLALLWFSTRLSFATGADISIGIYRRTLYQSYATHCARNSSEVINGISSKADGVIHSIILPTLTLVSSGIMLIGIFVALMMLQPLTTLIAFSGFGLIYLLIIRLTRKRIIINSNCVAHESTQVIKSIQEGLGGIRDVLVDGSQETYCQIYQDTDSRLRRAQGSVVFTAASPRFGMEALGMLLIAALTYFLSQQPDGIVKVIPILGALALGAQRLLPAMQQSYSSWMHINGGRASLKDVLDLLDQPLPDFSGQQAERLAFKKSIALNRIGFSYKDGESFALNNINLTIKKGSRVGLIGATGSGKSTLIDVVMGLLEPTHGTLEVDSQIITLTNCRAWQAHIAHVPQSIFLADSTVEENIAFGIPRDQIDLERVKLAAQQAQISDVIESLPKQYQTHVGERGIRLSGGQRQRIGIARALYKQADVIIFDEATSALDSETENAVMQSIESLSKELTLLIIAHRLTTLQNCTEIVELSEGCIKHVGEYQDLVNQ